MKIGQTSILLFISKLTVALIGFIATIYFARLLGAEVIGIFALVTTVAGWLAHAGELSIGSALVKRISEGEEQGAYLTAGILLTGSIGLIVTLLTLVFQSALENYIGDFDTYVALSVVWFVIVFVFLKLFSRFVMYTLKGQRDVHLTGILNVVKGGGKSILQIALVYVGWELLGMLVGYAVGTLLAGLIGLYWISIRPSIPAKRHFMSLFDYAKYSILGTLKSKAFNEVDILMLGAFVSTGLVGVYSVAWSLAKFLDLFSRSIRDAMFPEISFTSKQEATEAAAGMIQDSIAYTGLIAIPGLVGAVILSDRLMALYGPEFVEGADVLGLLVLAVLLYSYYAQFLNALNGIDRPDIAFRINLVFISANVTLNAGLIWKLGIEGAAVASVLSVGVGFALSYYTLKQLVDFETPIGEPLRQSVSAVVMGILVWLAQDTIETFEIITNNTVLVMCLVLFGTAVYFLLLFGLSSRFRRTVAHNLPDNIVLRV